GRYLIFTRIDGNWYNDVYIGDSESGKVFNVTANPGNYGNPRFSTDGRIAYFTADGEIAYVFLQRHVHEMTWRERQLYFEENSNGNGGTPPVQIDFEDISQRTVKLTNLGQVDAVTMTADAREFLFSTKRGHIWRIKLDGSGLQLLASDLDSPTNLQVAPEENFLYFRDATGRFYSLDVNNAVLRSHPYQAEVTVDRVEELQKVFEQTVATLRERFYDESLHQVDFIETAKQYRTRAATATTSRDLYDIIRQMMGELNASHLAIWPELKRGDQTGHLGIIPDYDHSGSGQIISAIVSGSPADRNVSRLKKGEKITGIENRKITGQRNYYQLLDGRTGKETRLDLINREGITRSVVITPIAAAEYDLLIHNQWVKANRKVVTQVSSGEIGYIHIRQIDDASLRRVEHDIALHTMDRKGLIIDIRGNVGGSAHDRLLELFYRRAYVNRRPRHGATGSDARVAFAGPIVLLVNERTSSDAELFAYGFRKLSLGTIIGTSTYGAVIGTQTRTLIDGSTLAIPSVGWFTLEGENLEGCGIEPDIEAPVNLTLLEKGEDSQLKQTILHLLEQID
ncbi:MAG: PD40 domain-containing protein, partial [candidate division Zixibacteria bacterium]|nr:PD40 domain-containing protein [candidate division Zixibacteria bacterium]